MYITQLWGQWPVSLCVCACAPEAHVCRCASKNWPLVSRTQGQGHRYVPIIYIEKHSEVAKDDPKMSSLNSIF